MDFSDESSLLLAECATAIKTPGKTYLLKEGEICDAVFFISKGLCRTTYNSDGKIINTAFFFENDFVTDIKSLSTSSASAYAIQCYEACNIISLDKTKLLAAYAKSHHIESFGRRMLEIIIARQEEHANSFKLLNPKQRFERLIASRRDFLQRVPLSQAASYLGISRETLTRYRTIAKNCDY